MPFTSRWMLRTRRSARCSGVSLAGTGFVTDISCPPRPSVVKALSVARASHTAVEAGAHRASRLPAPGRLLSASSPRTSGARPPEACGIPRGRRGAERGRRRGGQPRRLRACVAGVCSGSRRSLYVSASQVSTERGQAPQTIVHGPQARAFDRRHRPRMLRGGFPSHAGERQTQSWQGSVTRASPGAWPRSGRRGACPRPRVLGRRRTGRTRPSCPSGPRPRHRHRWAASQPTR